MQEIIVEGLNVTANQLPKHFFTLKSLLGNEPNENREIDLQTAISALNSRNFRFELRSFFSTTELLDDIELIKAALFLCTANRLSISLLRTAVHMCRTDNVWRYRRFEALREESGERTQLSNAPLYPPSPLDSDLTYADGISLHNNHLHTVLRALSRFLPSELLTVWVSRYLTHPPDYVTLVEFLYLLGNSFDRKTTLESLPLTPKVTKTEGKFGVFPIADVTFDRCSPDRCAQTIANNAIKSLKMSFLREIDPKNQSLRAKKRTMREKSVRKSDGDLDFEVSSVLKTPKLRREIKNTLRNQIKRVSLSKVSHSPRATDLISLKTDPKSPLLSFIRGSELYQMRYSRAAHRLKTVLFPVSPSHHRANTAFPVISPSESPKTTKNGVRFKDSPV